MDKGVKKDYERLTPEGMTKSSETIASINDVKSQKEQTSIIPKDKKADYTPKKATEDTLPKEKPVTTDDISKQLTQYNTDLMHTINQRIKPEEKKEEPKVSAIPMASAKELADIRPGQIKNFAMEEKVASKAPIATTEPDILPGAKKSQDMILPKNIKDLSTTQKPEYHESASVHPKWTDMHIIPSKAGNSKVESSYVKPITGKDSSFNSASADASQ